MNKFDSQKVLETILQEAPHLSNRRGEIPVRGESRVIYAFYYNRGFPDPELAYNRVRNPSATTPLSTLCEVYSFWEGDPNVQDLLKRLKKEGQLKPREVIHQGPWLQPPALNDDEIVHQTREGTGYSFHHSASTFERHFNKICSTLGYEPQLTDSTLEVPRDVQITVAGQVKDGKIRLKAPIGIDLHSEDPTLRQVLGVIEQAYQKIVKFDLTSAELYVR